MVSHPLEVSIGREFKTISWQTPMFTVHHMKSMEKIMIVMFRYYDNYLLSIISI